MANVCDAELHDFERFDEIQLLGELIVLASESEGDPDIATIDETLGVHPALPSQRRF